MSVRGTVCVSGGGVSGGGGGVSPANDGRPQPESHRADIGPGIVIRLRYGKYSLP